MTDMSTGTGRLRSTSRHRGGVGACAVEALAEKVAGGMGGVSLGQGVALSAVDWGGCGPYMQEGRSVLM